jgi:tetraacyldisaccharide 4'-kinase
MNPLSALFGKVVSARNRVYDSGRIVPQKLRGPVISIGNLSVGGSGKTPFVIALGEWLLQRNIPFDILSRGYKRRSTGVLRVDPNGSAEVFGDEPLMRARRLGVPVWVGKTRFAAGSAAEAEYGPRLHLLDDGFQHRALARQFDILLLSDRDFDDTLLPVGRLREPLDSMRRADAVVVLEDVVVEDATAFHGFAGRLWTARRSLILPEPVPKRPLVVCGIARPEPFFAQLRALGVQPAREVAYADHQQYTIANLRTMQRLARQLCADALLTTEKDYVKLAPLIAEVNLPLQMARLVTELKSADAVFSEMLQAVRERKPDWNYY